MSPSLANSPKWLKYGLIIMSIAAIVILTKQLGIADWLAATLQNALTQVDTWGVWAPIGFILIYNIATVLLIPGSILTLGSGVLFGIGWGSFYVFIAATLGATLAFLIGRYFARDWVNGKVQKNPKFQTIDQAIAPPRKIVNRSTRSSRSSPNFNPVPPHPKRKSIFSAAVYIF
jgi:uncharacterized membrane protein YdjX (TVP38/TMEM64 family)